MKSRTELARRPGAAAAVLAALLLAGCRQDMHDQPRYEPLEESSLFENGAASRPRIEGTVPRGLLREDVSFHTGLEADGAFVAAFPMAVDRRLLERGRDRYDAFCAPCHDRVGNGRGMIVRRGFKQPNSFHEQRLREAAPGYLVNVMTNGFGQMSSYAAQLAPSDRWAVAAYVKALQLSQNASRELLDAGDLERLAGGGEPRPETAEAGH